MLFPYSVFRHYRGHLDEVPNIGNPVTRHRCFSMGLNNCGCLFPVVVRTNVGGARSGARRRSRFIFAARKRIGGRTQECFNGAMLTKNTATAICPRKPLKGKLSGGEETLWGVPPHRFSRSKTDRTISSLLITRFFSPTPEMKARGHAVSKRHRKIESTKWLLK